MPTDYLARTEADNRVDRPETLLVELTNHCNLKCGMCPRSYALGTEMTKGAMPLERFTALIDDAAVAIRHLVLVGLGEVLLYKPLLSAAEYVYRVKPSMKMSIVTNATLPGTAATLRAIADRLDTTILISIDGVEGTYNAIRCNANYDSFTRIAGAVAAQIGRDRTAFNMVVGHANYSQMADVVRLADRLGIGRIHFNTLNIVSLPHLSMAVYDLYRTGGFVEALASAHACAKERGIEVSSFDFAATCGFQSCGSPWDEFYITWDGYLAQCCASPFPAQSNFGNVFDEGGLWACVNSPKFRELRQMWRDNVTPTQCVRCHKVALRQPESVNATRLTVVQ